MQVLRHFVELGIRKHPVDAAVEPPDQLPGAHRCSVTTTPMPWIAARPQLGLSTIIISQLPFQTSARTSDSAREPGDRLDPDRPRLVGRGRASALTLTANDDGTCCAIDGHSKSPPLRC